MKKFRFFSFASAMLLASAAGMVSCSSDSIEPTSGPGATGQVVKTQFAINIRVTSKSVWIRHRSSLV